MMQHSPAFYRVSAVVFPFALAALARAVRLRWPATAAAAAYMAVMLALMWILQLFPATPKLGPIYQHITHMVTLAFPLWLVAPAIVIDVVYRRFAGQVGTLPMAAMLGAAFLVAFIAVQWPFATFLVENPASRNGLFNADNYVYWAGPTYVASTHRFPFVPTELGAIVRGYAPAYVYAAIAAAVGLVWGRWMTKVQR
jgi:hypothetical protein